MPFIIGLTGSIGMGKSTTAQMFVALGIPVWDADAAVHRMYGPGGAAVEPLGSLYPAAIVDGAVSRDRLKDWIRSEPTALTQIEAIVHPLVTKDRQRFLDGADAPMVLVDVPLLFETEVQNRVDHVVVVSAPFDVQKARVLARPGMTEERFTYILSQQMPDVEKRARADTVIETTGLDDTRAQVESLLAKLRSKLDA